MTLRCHCWRTSVSLRRESHAHSCSRGPARISQGERGNEINMGGWVRYIFVEPQTDHV